MKMIQKMMDKDERGMRWNEVEEKRKLRESRNKSLVRME